MNKPQSQPIYWDRNRSSVNLLLIFALAVAVVGIFSEGPGLLLMMGLAVAAYSWLTSARQYVIYPDSLVIMYGKPRNKVISFAEISHLETLTLPIGDRLRVRLVSGQRLMLTVKDTETFRERLDRALEDFSGQRGAIVEGSSEPENTIIDQDAVEPAETPADEPHDAVDQADSPSDEQRNNSPY